MTTNPEQNSYQFVDIRRAISDMRDEMEDEDETPEEYVGLVHLAHESKAPYSRFSSQLARRAVNIKYELKRREYAGGVSYQKVVVDRDTTPGIFIDRHLHRGFTLGLHVNHKILGRGSSIALAPYVDEVMDSETEDPAKYAKCLESIGGRTYINNLSNPTDTLTLPRDPLRTFVEDLTDDMYGNDIDKLVQFKTGVGLARGAFNLLSRNIDSQLRGIRLETEKTRA